VHTPAGARETPPTPGQSLRAALLERL